VEEDQEVQLDKIKLKIKQYFENSKIIFYSIIFMLLLSILLIVLFKLLFLILGIAILIISSFLGYLFYLYKRNKKL
jgi:hypothetical protein